MLTLIPLLNPPRGRRKRRKLYGAAAAARAAKLARRNPSHKRKPTRETSTARRKRRKSKEVATMAKRRRKRGRGGRFVKAGAPKRRRRRSSGKARRRSSRRRRTVTVSVNPPRRRRKNPTVLVRRGRRYRRLVTAKKVYTRRTRGPHKGSLRRLNPRRRRRNPVVLVRRGRRIKSYGEHRRVYTRRRRTTKRGHSGTIRRMNPFGIKLPGVLNGLNLDLAIQGVQVGAGLVISQVAPGYVAAAIGKPGWARGAKGLGLGLASNLVLSTLLALSPRLRRASRNILIGAAAGIGASLIRMAVGAVTGRVRTPASAPAAQNGMGALVSPEAMIETQALLSGVGDFVQLSGAVPRGDFRGMGDYIEFGSQAAGANALAAQLAPQQVFSPGADEKF